MADVIHIAQEYVDRLYPDADSDTDHLQKTKVKNLIKKIEAAPDIFGCIPLDAFSPDERSSFIDRLLNSNASRQVLDNLQKTNANASFAELDEKDITETYSFLDSPVDFGKQFNSARYEIRLKEDFPQLIDDLLEANEKIVRRLAVAPGAFKSPGYKPEVITAYADYVISEILQFLMYPIMLHSDISTHDATCVLDDKITNLTDNMNKKIAQTRERQKDKGNLKADLVMHTFCTFINHRNVVYENSDIEDALVKEMDANPELFKEVPDEYRAIKGVLVNEMSDDEIMQIITEGTSKPYQYDNKLTTARKLADIFSKYGGRLESSMDIQDLKVYYRELYVSKSKWERQTAKTIAEDYIAKVDECEKRNVKPPQFDSERRYIFLREKISRGHFREENHASFYKDKIDITNKLNALMLKAYWLHSGFDSFEWLADTNRALLNSLKTLFE